MQGGKEDTRSDQTRGQVNELMDRIHTIFKKGSEEFAEMVMLNGKLLTPLLFEIVELGTDFNSYIESEEREALFRLLGTIISFGGVT